MAAATIAAPIVGATAAAAVMRLVPVLAQFPYQ